MVFSAGLDKLHISSEMLAARFSAQGTRKQWKTLQGGGVNETDARDEERQESLIPVPPRRGCTPALGLLETKPPYCLNCI